MANEVAVKGTNEIEASDFAGVIWETPEISSQDILLPKALLMQGSSELVAEGKAVLGEFRDSLTGDLLGGIEKPFEVIPFHLMQSWDLYKFSDDSNQFEYEKTVPLVVNKQASDYNDNWKWTEEVNGEQIKRVRRINLFVLLRNENIASSLPYILSFKSSSYKEGQNVLNQMYVRNKMAGLPDCAYSFTVNAKREKNDKATFAVPVVKLGTKITRDEFQICAKWKDIVKTSKVKIDEKDINKDEHHSEEAPF